MVEYKNAKYICEFLVGHNGTRIKIMIKALGTKVALGIKSGTRHQRVPKTRCSL